MFTSVRALRVYEHSVEHVERAIFDGRLRRGDRLPPERFRRIALLRQPATH